MEANVLGHRERILKTILVKKPKKKRTWKNQTTKDTKNCILKINPKSSSLLLIGGPRFFEVLGIPLESRSDK